MTWLNPEELTKLWGVAKNLADFDFGEASDEDKVDNYLDRLLGRPKVKAYNYEKAAFLILDVIEAQLGKRPTQKINREVKLWCQRRGRESANETLQYPKVRKSLQDSLLQSRFTVI